LQQNSVIYITLKNKKLILDDFIANLQKIAKEKHSENKKFFSKLKQKPTKNLDYVTQELHTNEFKKTDCLQCGNYCKNTAPLLQMPI